jgi:hypothetical protein
MNTPFCAHVWFDPEDHPYTRAAYSPVIGPARHEMKPGRRYVCRRCPAELKVPTKAELLASWKAPR